MPQSIFMLIPLAIVMGIGVAFYLYSRWRTRRLLEATEIETFDWVPRKPILLENPKAWLAIKAETAQEVQAALGLHHALPCSWAEGLELATEEKLFISPPVEGWVLVFGAPLPDPADDIDEFFKFILDLSRKAGLVIYFRAERVFDQHAWVKAINGRIVRAYAWADEALWNQGELTQAERDLKLRCEAYSPARELVPPHAREAARFNCDRLPALAARWSLDPKSVDARMVKQQIGIAGEFSQGKPH